MKGRYWTACVLMMARGCRPADAWARSLDRCPPLSQVDMHTGNACRAPLKRSHACSVTHGAPAYSACQRCPEVVAFVLTEPFSA